MSYNRVAAIAATILALGSSTSVSAAPSIAGAVSKPGLSQTGALSNCFPVTGAATRAAIGPTTLVQVIHCKAAIINRTTGLASSASTLDILAGAPGAFGLEPQVIWDATTQRFYYAMATFQSSGAGFVGSIAYGFSKTASPANLSTDWCHYSEGFGSASISGVRLGDSVPFLLIGYTGFSGGLSLGASVFAVSKPPAGAVCPAATTFKKLNKNNLKDAGGNSVNFAQPANQIDGRFTGYVTASAFGNSLAIYTVSRSATGAPVIGPARMLTLPPFLFPPSAAAQPPAGAVASPTLRIDFGFSQPVQAVDPRLLNRFTMWMAHTVADPANPNASRVRWYEIDPVPVVPVIVRRGEVGVANTFVFNPAISPDRRVDGAISQFGNSFVLEASQSSATIAPRLLAYSSVNGGVTTGALIRQAVGPYRDTLCPAGTSCFWGVASAQPDPRPVPTVVGKGVVWGSGQYSGILNPLATNLNLTTWNAAIAP